METVKLSELFDIHNGYSANKFSNISSTKTDEYNLAYIRPSSKISNTLSGYVKESEAPIIYDENTLFVSTNGEGSHSYSYVMPIKFVHSNNSCVLIPKKEMSLLEKQFYALCITKNRYRFSYGRLPVGDRLAILEVPADIPDWVYEVEEPDLSDYRESFNSNKTPELNIDEWKEFKLTDLFDLKNGKGYLSSEALENPGDNPFVCSSETNNGIACYTSLANTHKGNCLTINKDGSVGCAFYQKKDFSTNKHVIVATPTFKNFNQYIAMFLIPIIELEKFKYCFGRAWGLDRMETTIIKLPATQNGEPDYEFMEEYIKTLPYSKHI